MLFFIYVEWKISDDYDWGWEDAIDGVEVRSSDQVDNFLLYHIFHSVILF